MKAEFNTGSAFGSQYTLGHSNCLGEVFGTINNFIENILGVACNYSFGLYERFDNANSGDVVEKN